MRFKPDLHIHTTASDGLTSPQNIAAKAEAQGVNLIAITDHDSIEGVLAYCQGQAVQMLAGVEMSAALDWGEVHILAYGNPLDNGAFRQYLQTLQVHRQMRVYDIIKQLKQCGLPLTKEDLPQQAGVSLGRKHVAQALVQKGYAASIGQAFEKYLTKGKLGYVPRELPVPSKVIAALRDFGLVPVLAHPGRIRQEGRHLEALLKVWQSAGLMGIEAYHPSHGDNRCFDQFAREQKLLVTGGSDYHGEPMHVPIGHMLAQWPNADADAKRLLEAIAKQ